MSSHDSHASHTKVYFIVFALLLVLLALTIAAARIADPVLNTVVALTIASTKAGLIIVYFMHLRFSTPLTKVIAISGFIWLAILIVFTLSDFATRSW